MSDKSSFIPEDDVEFENDLAQKAKLAREQDLKRRQEQIEAENAERKSYERKLQEQKVELLRLKQGVIDHSDEIKEIKEKRKSCPSASGLKTFGTGQNGLFCSAFFYALRSDILYIIP